MITPQGKTNIKNRVNKIYLPKTRPLYPLFEVISNSVHAIFEAKKNNQIQNNGSIKINILRIGKAEAFKEISNTDEYPINSFEVIDNGIGLDFNNFNSFQEFDSEYKSEIGGKGVGRLVCLKAFNRLIIESKYLEGKNLKTRSFEFKKTAEGYHKYQEKNSAGKVTGTKITLADFEKPYSEMCPRQIIEIGRQIVSHFQLYFIQKIQPEIILHNQDGVELNLNKLFNSEFKTEIISDVFHIDNNKFEVFISKTLKTHSHKLHFCANERTVKTESLNTYVTDLKYGILDTQTNEYYYFDCFIVSEILSKNVNDERTSFNFENIDEENEDLDSNEITLSRIRKKAIQTVEYLLKDILTLKRTEKLNHYIPVIENKYPNYKQLLHRRKDYVEKLPAGLNDKELDVKLYEIEADWKIEVKKEGVNLIENSNPENLDDYKEKYKKFLTDWNEIGQSDLSRYIIHRKAVIDFLNTIIQLDEGQKFKNEDVIHNLFFPMKKDSESIFEEEQNLWLLDERMTYHSFLTSDNTFKKNENLTSESIDRTDILIYKEDIYNKAFLYSENKNNPYNSFTIIEFKKPGRNDYFRGNPKKDPVAQIQKYINELLTNKVKSKNGREIKVDKTTPFYVYVVADITPTLESILREEEFKKTPDGQGYFKIKTEYYTAYIEVIPFDKVINDANQRNKILFDKLGLSID